MLEAMLTCASMSKNQKGIVSVALYVDNNLMIGDSDDINKAITALKEYGHVLKVMEGL